MENQSMIITGEVAIINGEFSISDVNEWLIVDDN